MTRLAGVELVPGEVRVARLERPLAGRPALRVERHAVADAAATAAVLGAVAAWRPHVVRVALPLAAVAHRVLALPFADRRRIARVAPLELLGQLPGDVDGARVACAALGPAGAATAVLAAVARDAELAALVAPLREAGLAPERIELAPLPVLRLLPPAAARAIVIADGARSAVLVERDGRLAGLRALAADARHAAAFAAETAWSLHALGGVPAVVVAGGADATPPLRAALAAACGVPVAALGDVAAARPGLPSGRDVAAAAVAAGLVVEPGGRDVPSLAWPLAPRLRSLRRTAALAAAAAVLGLVDTGLVRQGLVRREAALAAAIDAEAAAALPGVRLVAPRDQLEQAAAAAARRDARLGAPGAVLDLLREVSARVPPSVRLDLDELAVDADGVVVRGRAERFEAVEALRRALAASPALADVRAEETRPALDGHAVVFRLRATRRPPGGVPS